MEVSVGDGVASNVLVKLSLSTMLNLINFNLIPL